jgi:hypothetical protein
LELGRIPAERAWAWSRGECEGIDFQSFPNLESLGAKSLEISDKVLLLTRNTTSQYLIQVHPAEKLSYEMG